MERGNKRLLLFLCFRRFCHNRLTKLRECAIIFSRRVTRRG
nr:MAG TPA: hypothetical protein [Caudoviricetes sp.]